MKKSENRKVFSEKRKSIPVETKQIYDKSILSVIINSQIIYPFDKVLCYVSVNDEADTRALIDYLLEIGKDVYVPHCKNRVMNFYQLNNTDELIEGAFGIPTVDTSAKTPLVDFDKCICIVPALAFDMKGYRLGYGGGYYDRFLDGKNIFKLGISYEICLTQTLPCDPFDITVDAVITEKAIRKL